MEVKEKDNILTTNQSWDNIFEDKELVQMLLSKVFPAYLQKCRWFGGKSKKIKHFKIQFLLTFPVNKSKTYLVILEAAYIAAYSESYFLPVCFSEDEKVDKKAIITPIELKGKSGILMDAIYEESFRNALFEHILKQKDVDIKEGILHFNRGSILDGFDKNQPLSSTVLKVDQSNTSIIYNDQYFFKIYRNLFRETNPDYEITKFLTENAGFKNSPRYAGSITWKREKLADVSLGLMQEKVENEGDAWHFVNDKIKKYFEKVVEQQIPLKSIEDLDAYEPHNIRDLEPETVDLIGYDMLKSIEKLGQRTAEMHIAISSDRSSYTFLPVLYNQDYSVWLKNRLIYQLDRRLDLLEKTLENLQGLSLEFAKKFLESKEEIINIIVNFDEAKLISKRIRIHGDYHLGQVLKKGDDFIILDFEGEPESTIRDRKVKQPPVKDVAGMIRSFHYAVYNNIFDQSQTSSLSQSDLFEIGNKYYRIITSVYLNAYTKTAMSSSLDIGYQSEINYVLKYHLLEKAIYELGYELNSRPNWAIIPLKGIMDLLEG
jgi:maltose alpha-D-glucosyltransferase/alpha-amylase